jgi:hypothetical protein
LIPRRWKRRGREWGKWEFLLKAGIGMEWSARAADAWKRDAKVTRPFAAAGSDDKVF